MSWSWQQTYTGRRFDFKNPDPADVDIQDIAHSLAMQCRFNGHVREFYSVAQHSVMVAQLVPAELKLAALLHDAAEAYLGDLITPVKALMHEGYHALERRVEDAVFDRFGIPADVRRDPRIKQADRQALALEAIQLLPHPPRGWDLTTDLSFVTVSPLSPASAKQQFLRYFHRLNF